MRKGLAQRMNLKFTPEVRFIKDEALERGSRVRNISVLFPIQRMFLTSHLHNVLGVSNFRGSQSRDMNLRNCFVLQCINQQFWVITPANSRQDTGHVPADQIEDSRVKGLMKFLVNLQLTRAFDPKECSKVHVFELNKAARNILSYHWIISGLLYLRVIFSRSSFRGFYD